MSSVKGSIPDIIRNADNVYEGNLIYYFKVIFLRSRNADNPYHNIRHMLHVFYLCYKACLFYGSLMVFNKRTRRHLLIAALFHDFDHSGVSGPDIINIRTAIEGLRLHILPEDKPFCEEIEGLIKETEFPYKIPSEQLDLSAQILRDADLSQSLSVAWIQQVIFGLAKEWGKTPLEVLKMQEGFLGNLHPATSWAKTFFTQEDIQAKIQEAKELLEILETPDDDTA